MGFFNRRPDPRPLAMAVSSGPGPCPEIVAVDHDPGPGPQTKALHSDLGPAALALVQSQGAKRRRRKPLKIARLYRQQPKEPTTAEVHAAMLVELLTEAGDVHPALRQGWIPREDLERYYFEIAASHGWQPLSWTAMGTALGAVMARCRSTVRGERGTYYRLRKS